MQVAALKSPRDSIVNKWPSNQARSVVAKPRRAQPDAAVVQLGVDRSEAGRRWGAADRGARMSQGERDAQVAAGADQLSGGQRGYVVIAHYSRVRSSCCASTSSSRACNSARAGGTGFFLSK